MWKLTNIVLLAVAGTSIPDEFRHTKKAEVPAAVPAEDWAAIAQPAPTKATAALLTHKRQADVREKRAKAKNGCTRCS